ncbi:MAG: NAD(P)H-dependent oxidoreductase [Alphaproteobacteria bacterium]|nr:NAD(P)H-dependent oxidoreductase [Alphaproteobacteria bacterium]MCB9673135.1 NAD(P)H-dependent oxidoreductase [Alphaproteobacteria bacterium]
MKVVAVCGSLRRASLNRRLLVALAARAPEGVQVDIAELRGIPVYDGDLEDAEGLPDAVVAQDRIASADALLIGSPEYNGGVPGPLKNALDWCSRGGRAEEVFAGRPTGLCGATPGPWGTRMAQQAWLLTFRQLGVELYGGQLYVPRAHTVLAEDGTVEAKTGERLARFIEGFAAFATR